MRNGPVKDAHRKNGKSSPGESMAEGIFLGEIPMTHLCRFGEPKKKPEELPIPNLQVPMAALVI